MLFDQLKRREFITRLGSAAVAWPLAARAQQAAMPVIGFLHQGSAGANVKVIDAFRHGLQEAGYEEGRNAHVEFRWADGHYERLGALAAEVVRLRPAVMAAALLPRPTDWQQPSCLRHRQPRRPPRPFRSFSSAAPTRSRAALSRA